jgi:hypothetical protein
MEPLNTADALNMAIRALLRDQQSAANKITPDRISREMREEEISRINEAISLLIPLRDKARKERGL